MMSTYKNNTHVLILTTLHTNYDWSVESNVGHTIHRINHTPVMQWCSVCHASCISHSWKV